MSTLVMVRTVCCEGYKTFGKRCSLCPHRLENQEALENYKVAVRGLSLRRAVAACDAAEFGARDCGSSSVETASNGLGGMPQ